MALGNIGSGIAKKILVSIDVMTDQAQNKLKNFERQTQRAATSVSQSVTGEVGNAQSKLDQFGVSARGVGDATQQASGRVRTMTDRIATFGKDTKFASDMANSFRMDMLSVMFAGMQLMSVFGGMIGKMLKFTGASSAMGAAMKSVLLPITMALQPALLALSEMLIGLDRNSKLILGAVVLFLALAGAVAFVGAQTVMLAGAIEGLTISVFGLNIAVASLLGLIGIFAAGIAIGILAAEAIQKALGTLVSAIMTIVVPALFLLAVAAGVISAPVWAIVLAVGILIGGIIALSDEIIAFFGSLPKIIGDAVNGAVKFMKNLWNDTKRIFGNIVSGIANWVSNIAASAKKIGEKIWSGIVNTITGIGRKVGGFIKGVIDKLFSFAARVFNAAKKLGKKIINGVVNFVSNLPSKVIGFVRTLISKIKNIGASVMDAAKNIGSSMIDGIVNGIKNAPDALMDAIKEIAPDWVVDALGAAGDAISGAVTSVTDAAGNMIPVNDFVMTPSGDVLKTAPDDYIFGTKSPGALAGGGGSNVTINIDAEVANDIDIRDLADEIEDRMDRRTGGRSNIGGRNV